MQNNLYGFCARWNKRLSPLRKHHAHVMQSLDEAAEADFAAANCDRILSDAIPSTSMVMGANAIPKFSPPESPLEKNIDMMTLENGWSPGRTGGEAKMWHHSDFVDMAYTFTYQLYNKLATTGNLK